MQCCKYDFTQINLKHNQKWKKADSKLINDI